MQHIITIGDLVWWGLVAGGVVAVIAIILGIISAIGSGFSR